MSNLEAFGRKNNTREEITEDDAEEQLQALLDDPENSFLSEVKENREIIENSERATDALAFAKSRIIERLSKTTHLQSFEYIEGVSLKEVDLLGLKRTVDSILKNKIEIGRGGDAFVVIDKNEVRELPPEVCYKFALTEKTPRGRNDMFYEAELQGLFYDAALEKTESIIGVPIPFYCVEIGHTKMIAMEKLNARSLDDIRRGKGFIPEWLDVDKFCEELSAMLKHFHKKELYHRDMHIGNVMISQKLQLDDGDKEGYIIDFGLSGISSMEEFAYVKQVAGTNFTYTEDYGILEQARLLLNELKSRGV